MNCTSRATWLFRFLFALSFLYGNTARAQINGLFKFAEPLVSFETNCGTTDCHEVRFMNVGAQPITITLIETPTTDFSLDPSNPLPNSFRLPSGETQTTKFCYTPNDPEGSSLQKIIVEVVADDNVLRGFDTLTLSGTSRSAQLQFDPQIITFGDITASQESCVPVVVRNTGTQEIDVTTLKGLAFPFKIDGLPPTNLKPGDEQELSICFSPFTQGSFADTLTLSNGDCREPVSLFVQGNGLSFVANIGPVLQVVSVDFDTTLCGTEKCRSLTLRNVGTDSLQVIEAEQIPIPFSGSISPLPITIPANEEQTFTICYSPKSIPSIDSAEVKFRADNRVPLSIAAVFDISKSMVGSFGGVRKIDAANGAGRLFIGNLVNEVDRGIIDEGAVYVFGQTEAFARLEGYVTDRSLLQNAVPTAATADSTCLFDAIIRVSAELGTRNTPGRRMMVLLTDGRNDCVSSSITLNDAITAAQNAGIQVYTIGIGAINPFDLTQIAEQTGGFYSEALTPAGLLASYQRIINALSKDQPAQFTLKGRSVAPELEVSHQSVSFDSVRIGEQQCTVITLKNTGDAPLNINSFVRPSLHFNVRPATIPEIPPGDSVSLQVCFEPKKLRTIDSIITFGYSRCVPESKSVRLDGIGYDSVVISMQGVFYARSGDVVNIPVRLQGRVPASYGMDSLELTFRYNKTLLHPEPFDAPLASGTGVAKELSIAVGRTYV